MSMILLIIVQQQIKLGLLPKFENSHFYTLYPLPMLFTAAT